jgi:hypothetical protein
MTSNPHQLLAGAMIGRAFGMSSDLTSTLEAMGESAMGIYQHLGWRGCGRPADGRWLDAGGDSRRDALAAEHDARSGMAEWPSFRDSGFGVKAGGRSGNVGLLCDVAKAQARAGLAAKASASFEEASLAAQSMGTFDPHYQGPTIATSLADVADAQHQAGLNAAARETLARAVTAEEAIADERLRLIAQVRVTQVQLKMADAAQAPYVPALSIARALPDKPARGCAKARRAIPLYRFL